MSYVGEYGYDGGRASRRRLTKVSALLCLLCKNLEGKQMLGQIIQETQATDLQQFWRQNKKGYARREARLAAQRSAKVLKAEEKRDKEKLKASALGKLTDAEKRALNIKIPAEKKRPKRRRQADE